MAEVFRLPTAAAEPPVQRHGVGRFPKGVTARHVFHQKLLSRQLDEQRAKALGKKPAQAHNEPSLDSPDPSQEKRLADAKDQLRIAVAFIEMANGNLRAIQACMHQN